MEHYVGSMNCQSSMKRKEAAVDAWLDIMSGAGKAQLNLQVEKAQAGAKGQLVSASQRKVRLGN